MQIRTIIADDEALARGRIRRLLADDDEIELIGEARNGGEAVALIQQLNPELLLLDIEMPDLNGFEVIRKLGDNIPYVIFITAFDTYAARAFEVHAIDYVLKPYDNERFKVAIKQVKEKMKLEMAREMHDRMMLLMNDYLSKPEQSDHVFEVKHKGVIQKIKSSLIRRLQADGNYVKLYSDKGRYLLRESLNRVEEKLPATFVRVHRSAIVNSKFVSDYKYLGNNRFCLEFSNGENVETGRSYAGSVRKMLAGNH